jgi:HPt (histidine-containing phosphotransfer) domain-containing protein
MAAHSLKSASGAVGANRLVAICQDLETLARNATLDGTAALATTLEGEFARVRQALRSEQRHAG